MSFIGEILALGVAVLWTISSLSSEVASKLLGSSLLNIVRMTLCVLIIGVALWIVTGSPLPIDAPAGAWMWLALSAFAGYIIGDYFFLKCFILIGARWGELFMTIAPIAAALTGFLLLGEQMSWLALLGMCVTISGICLSVFKDPLRLPQGGEHRYNEENIPERQILSLGRVREGLHLKLPIRGVIYGIIAGIGQGVGLVFSKQGMLLYKAATTAGDSALAAFTMPFAATMIRCLVALVGFIIMYAVLRRTGKENHAPSLIFSNRRAFGFAALSTLTGPCIGVALSLAATMYTTTGITQTIMSLVPVLILWPSHIFFHTKITPKEILGAIISVCGVALFFI